MSNTTDKLKSMDDILKEQKIVRYHDPFKKAMKAYSDEVNSELLRENKELMEALGSIRSLNLHLYEKGTVGRRVYDNAMTLLTNLTKIE